MRYMSYVAYPTSYSTVMYILRPPGFVVNHFLYDLPCDPSKWDKDSNRIQLTPEAVVFVLQTRRSNFGMFVVHACMYVVVYQYVHNT